MQRCVMRREYMHYRATTAAATTAATTTTTTTATTTPATNSTATNSTYTNTQNDNLALASKSNRKVKRQTTKLKRKNKVPQS